MTADALCEYRLMCVVHGFSATGPMDAVTWAILWSRCFYGGIDHA